MVSQFNIRHLIIILLLYQLLVYVNLFYIENDQNYNELLYQNHIF